MSHSCLASTDKSHKESHKRRTVYLAWVLKCQDTLQSTIVHAQRKRQLGCSCQSYHTKCKCPYQSKCSKAAHKACTKLSIRQDKSLLGTQSSILAFVGQHRVLKASLALRLGCKVYTMLQTLCTRGTCYHMESKHNLYLQRNLDHNPAHIFIRQLLGRSWTQYLSCMSSSCTLRVNQNKFHSHLCTAL